MTEKKSDRVRFLLHKFIVIKNYFVLITPRNDQSFRRNIGSMKEIQVFFSHHHRVAADTKKWSANVIFIMVRNSERKRDRENGQRFLFNVEHWWCEQRTNIQPMRTFSDNDSLFLLWFRWFCPMVKMFERWEKFNDWLCLNYQCWSFLEVAIPT